MMNNRRRSHSATRPEIRNRFAPQFSSSVRFDTIRPHTKINDCCFIGIDMKRAYIKEGAVQLTALDSLLTSSRYFFLFSDLLLVAKQKAANSYKLKERIRLDRIWLASNDCPHSFLIGWPIYNFIAHFATEEQKLEWETILQQRVLRSRGKISLRFTTIPVSVQIDGRVQVMKKKIGVSQTSSEILRELVDELAIPMQQEVQLLFDSGNGDGITALQGPECVFCIAMEYVKSIGCRLSKVQLQKIDALPLIQCRLVLASVGSFHSSTPSIVTHFKRVLSRSESRRFFGRPLEGSLPPQPVLTMIDHLILHGVNMEGLFRKSPKQSTVRMLKAQLDRGSLPDFYQFNPHVTAALLKEYLREIPGKLLLSGNFELWASAMKQTVDRRKAVRKLLQMLPSAHLVLLTRFLQLLRAISDSPQSRMTAQSLAVCIAPSLLDNPKMDIATNWLPDLAEYLIVNAPFLLEPFQDIPLPISSSVSNDSGLSDVDVCLEASVSTSDLGNLRSPTSGCSLGHYTSNNSKEGENEEVIAEVEHEDDDKTPVLSRENSNVQSGPVAPVGRQKGSEESGKTKIVLLHSRRPSDSFKKHTFLDDEYNNREVIGRKLCLESGTSPCYRKFDEHPPLTRRSVTVEGSPSSNRKSVTIDPNSSISVRKSSTASVAASLRSSSLLQSSTSQDLPESRVLLRGSSKQAEMIKTVDSETQSVSPLPVRRKDFEARMLQSSIRRNDSEAHLHTLVMGQKESFHPHFSKHQTEESTGSDPSSAYSSTTRKLSVPEGELKHVCDTTTYRTTNSTKLPQTKKFQMPVITPLVHGSKSDNKFLVRHASERVGNAEGAGISKLYPKSSSLRSGLKRSSISTANLDSITCKTESNAQESYGAKSIIETHCKHQVENKFFSKSDFYCSVANEDKKALLTNIDRNLPEVQQQSAKEEAISSNTEATSVSVTADGQSPMLLREHGTSGNCNPRIRKKTRSILMESLEVNWSVDEIRSKFQNTSEPPPFLDTIY